ncbi:Repressible alkaline phosphatase [Venturia nashicola]|nr:Repressible alkaline phosphatase [Venturia nashicola]
MISVADHETGGLTLPSGWEPRRSPTLPTLLSLVAEQLFAYGIQDANETLVNSIIESDNYSGDLADLLNAETGLAWSTGGHTGVDVTLYAYAHGDMGDELVKDLAGSHDNTEIPRLIEGYLGLDMNEITRLLREKVSWLQ